MLSITLTSLDLLNFQGTKKAHYDFTGNEVWVCGDNGTGKTTIADAFLWCLFGKNSKGKTDKDFDLKTLDSNGNVIMKQPHEVIAVLQVDNEKYTFKRCFCEKWVKQRGSIVETFEGHETKYFVNDVPKSMRDYKAKVAEIVDEDTFRFITDPTYFLSLKKDVQRNILLNMYGNVNDEEIASQRYDFVTLMAQLTGKTLEEYTQQLKAQLSMLKQNCEIIPVQIEERQRSISETPVEDWAKVQENLAALKAQQDNIKKQMSDNAARITAANAKQKQCAQEIASLESDMMAKEAELRRKLHTAYYDSKAKKERIESEINSLQSSVEMSKKSLSLIVADIENYRTQEAQVAEELAQVQAQKYVQNNDDLRCPTCGQPYKYERQVEIFLELEAKFNQRKAEKIKQLNQRKAFIADTIAELTKQATDNKSQALKKQEAIKSNQDTLRLYADLPTTAPNIDAQVANSDEMRTLAAQVEEAKRNAEAFAVPTDSAVADGFSADFDRVQGEINDLNALLANKAIIERDQQRIAELTAELQVKAQAMSDIENELGTIYDFRKAKVEAIESRINAQFDIVCFRMFKTQINGGEVEDCEALVGGVPYSRSLNNAARINAGLDIVNAFSRHYNVSAPVFVDNAEASNHFVQMDCQRIYLKVTNDKEITIK